MTTQMVKEIRRLNQEGNNDRMIAEKLGVSAATVHKYRTEMGIPAVRKVYTIWDAKTDELIVCGTAAECTKFMGYKGIDGFYSMVSRMTHGKGKKYHAEVEAGYELWSVLMNLARQTASALLRWLRMV